MSQLNTSSVLRGAAVALAIIVPVVLLVRVLDPDNVSSAWGWAYTGVILVATLVGSAVAGHRERETPLLHGAVTGLVTFTAAQVVASLIRGEAPNVIGFLFFAIAFMCLGTIGGFLGTVKVFEDRDTPGSGR